MSIESRAAVRTAIAALAAVLISFALHLKTPYWSGMTVVVVANLYTGSVIDKAMMRILGTLAGAVVGFYCARYVANSLALYFISCFLIIALSVYYYNISNYGYAYLLGALCMFLIIAQLNLDPHNAFFVAVWRPVEIGIGVLVSSVCAYSIFPNHIKENVPNQVAAIISDFLSAMQKLSLQIHHETPSFAEVLDSNLQMKRTIRKAVELIGVMRREVGIRQEYLDELRAFLDCMYQSARQLQYLLLTHPQPEDFVVLKQLPLQDLFTAIEKDLLAIQSVFSSSQPLQSPPELDLALQKFHLSAKQLAVPSDFVFALTTYFETLQMSLRNLYLLFSNEPVLFPEKEAVFTKQDRLQGDWELIRHCIKAGLSVILALAFWMVSNWPGGLNGIISSLMISIRKNLYDMKNISMHRVIGCLLGGGIALGPLAIVEMNLYYFCLVILLAVCGFSYLMFKSTKYTYIGLQGNIALIISLAQEGGPPIDLSPPLQRLGGIFIGIVASFIVANMLWRMDAFTALQNSIKKLKKYMRYNLVQLLELPRGQRKLHDLANVFWNARGLMENLLQEKLDAKKTQKLLSFRQDFESLVMLQAILSHIATTIDRDSALEAAKKLDVDLPKIERELLNQSLSLSEIDSMLTQVLSQKKSFEDYKNLVAYLKALRQLQLALN